jgi:hypothetical protein
VQSRSAHAAGRIRKPPSAKLTTRLDELTSFPSGAHDDMVDALIHGLTNLREQPAPGSFSFQAVGRIRHSAYDRWKDY